MQNFSIFQAILDASLIVQFVLLLLILMMVTTWAIFFYVRKTHLNIEMGNYEFLKMFEKESSTIQGLERMYHLNNITPFSGYFSIFKEIYGSVIKFNDQLVNANKGDIFSNVNLIDSSYMERCLMKSKDDFILKIDNYRHLLAIIANLSPFVGLFGTVWGIVHSFAALSTGGGSIELIAPGIAEALVATAIGIGTSIPASWFYNIYTAKVNRLKISLQNFGVDTINAIFRHITTFKN